MHLPPLTHTFVHLYSLSFICTHFPSFVLTSLHLYSLTFTLVPYMWASMTFLPYMWASMTFWPIFVWSQQIHDFCTITCILYPCLFILTDSMSHRQPNWSEHQLLKHGVTRIIKFFNSVTHILNL